jgi:hypothetical protein
MEMYLPGIIGVVVCVLIMLGFAIANRWSQRRRYRRHYLWN